MNKNALIIISLGLAIAIGIIFIGDSKEGNINKTNTTGDIYFGSALLGYGAGQQVAIDVYLGESINPLQ